MNKKSTSCAIKVAIALSILCMVILYCFPLQIIKYNVIDAVPKASLHCFLLETSNELPVISKTNIKPGKSIFFHETSCRSYKTGKVTILARQACSVESAARLHPKMNVYLLFSSPSKFNWENNESGRFFWQLLKYPNVKILHVDHINYFNGTIAEELFLSRKIESSSYSVAHFSDLIRLLTLHKYGGIYLDLDVVVQKNFDDLGDNFVAMDTKSSFANGIFRFSSDEFGKNITKHFLKELTDNYMPSEWGFNGPNVLKRVLTKLCSATPEEISQKGECSGLKVYNKSVFYEIPWTNKDMFFKTEYNEEVLNRTNNSHAVHVWNYLSANLPVNIKSNVSYSILAEKYCPNIFSTIEYNF